MPVELDVSNPGGRLAAGIYATVKWPIRGNGSVLWLPPSSVVTTSERTFVIRVDGDIAQWVDVKRGTMQGPWLRLSGHSKRVIRFFAVAAMRFVRGPA